MLYTNYLDFIADSESVIKYRVFLLKKKDTNAVALF